MICGYGSTVGVVPTEGNTQVRAAEWIIWSEGNVGVYYAKRLVLAKNMGYFVRIVQKWRVLNRPEVRAEPRIIIPSLQLEQRLR